MDWQGAIERNREALKRVLAGLVVLARPEMGRPSTHVPLQATGRALPKMDGPSPVVPAPTLPRRLHRAVLRLLRPAESAARRLIIVAARALGREFQAAASETSATPAAGRAAPPPRRPAPKSAIPALRGLGIAIVVPPGVVPAPPAPRRVSATLLLPLCDPPRSIAPRRRTVPPHAAPRILNVDGAAPHRLPSKPSPRDRVDATRLFQRLAALGAALDDLPGQARRFVRWQARRARALAREQAKAPAGAKAPLRRRRLSPLRLGRPPGLRARARASDDEGQDILRDMDWFARHALSPPDTS